LLHNCYFPHGLDFYGSFLGIQKDFLYNIADDIEYLHDSTHFHKNQDIKFKIENMDCKVKPITTEQYPTPAKRPRNTLMNTDKVLLRFGLSALKWKLSLDFFIKKIQGKL
jgi:dTDP-4-dehydrorhamnose reductase